MNEEIQNALGRLIEYRNSQDEYIGRYWEIVESFLDPVADEVGQSADVLLEGMHETPANLLVAYIGEEAIRARGAHESTTLIENYLDHRGWRESESVRCYLQAINTTNVELWEIVDLDNRFVQVRPFATTFDPTEIQLEGMADALSPGDCFGARMIEVDSAPCFTGAQLPIIASQAKRIQKLVTDILVPTRSSLEALVRSGAILSQDVDDAISAQVSRYRSTAIFQVFFSDLVDSTFTAKPTNLVSEDGYSTSPVKIRFPIRSVSGLESALNDIEELSRQSDRWVWEHKTEGSLLAIVEREGVFLYVQTFAKEFADAAMALITSHAHEHLGPALSLHEKVEDFYDLPDIPRSFLFEPFTPDLNQMSMDIFTDCFRRSIDSKPPILSGSTPRSCLNDPSSRENALAWLSKLKNPDGASELLRNYDFTWLSNELGLAKA